jgi:hypothetical protein
MSNPRTSEIDSAPKSELRSSGRDEQNYHDQNDTHLGDALYPEKIPPQGTAGRTQRMEYGTRQPLHTETSFVALILCIAYLASLCFYVYVRLANTIEWKGMHTKCVLAWPFPEGAPCGTPTEGACREPGSLLSAPDLSPRRYQVYVFCVEMMGVSALVPYALLLVVSTRPTGSKGLPPDDGISVGEKVFSINVLVPCYSESLEVRRSGRRGGWSVWGQDWNVVKPGINLFI